MAKNKADKYLSGGIKKREDEDAPQELLDLLSDERSEPERVPEKEIKAQKNVEYRHAIDVRFDSFASIYILVVLKYDTSTGEIVDFKEIPMYDNKIRMLDVIRRIFGDKIIGKLDFTEVKK